MKDIYIYPDTYVLINKLDIRDSKKLDEKENALGLRTRILGYSIAEMKERLR